MNIQFMQIAKVNSIVHNINWNIPRGLSILTPQIVEVILKINLSFDNTIVDKFIWTRFLNVDLSFKDAYECIRRNHIELFWTKFIWHPNIPPVNSLVT